MDYSVGEQFIKMELTLSLCGFLCFLLKAIQFNLHTQLWYSVFWADWSQLRSQGLLRELNERQQGFVMSAAHTVDLIWPNVSLHDLCWHLLVYFLFSFFFFFLREASLILETTWQLFGFRNGLITKSILWKFPVFKKIYINMHIYVSILRTLFNQAPAQQPIKHQQIARPLAQGETRNIMIKSLQKRTGN